MKKQKEMILADLEEKYDLILGYEEHFAYSLGKEVVEKPSASVWMILLPVLFVHHAYRINRYKEAVRAFAKGILDSKKKALDAAFEEVESGSEKPCRTADFFPELTASAPESDRIIAEKQVKVIRIQQRHYRNLLESPGETYKEIVKNAYHEPGQYRAFLARLEAAEKELNRYLTEKIHTDEASRAIVQKMERCCADFRELEIKNLL